MKAIKVKDHAEDVALFRSEVVGALTHKELRAAISSLRFASSRRSAVVSPAAITRERFR
jgi:hypothetical protein